MKILIFGNLGAGKTYLSQKIKTALPHYEVLAIDNFRRNWGDGTMEKEQLAKQKFLDAIESHQPQIIEATGLGDTGISIAQKLKDTTEPKIILLLTTSFDTCIARLQNRKWDIPYPAPPEKAFELAEQTQLLLAQNTIQAYWQNAKKTTWCELSCDQEIDVKNLISKILTLDKNETT